MIDVKELRIGNIVMETIYDFEPKEIVFKAENFTQPEDYYSPIPITEEGLYKLGFEKDYSNSGQIEAKYDFGGWHVQFRNGIYWFWQLKFFPYGREIKFIHQLQNIFFAMTETELSTLKSE